MRLRPARPGPAPDKSAKISRACPAPETACRAPFGDVAQLPRLALTGRGLFLLTVGAARLLLPVDSAAFGILYRGRQSRRDAPTSLLDLWRAGMGQTRPARRLFGCAA